MSETGVKQLTVPENVYDDKKKLVDQASVKQDIILLLKQYRIDHVERTSLLKNILSDITMYRESQLLPLKGLIISLLFTKYEITAVDAFNVIDSLLP